MPTMAELQGEVRQSRTGAYDEVVIGTEEVAGGRGDIRPGRRGPRRRPGNTSNPRATSFDVDPNAPKTPDYEEALLGRRRHRGAMAPQTEVPSKTTNPKKPRTLSAGYDRATQTLSVVFRDGTSWNYYGVTYQMWTAFKASPSPGRYIRTRLDFKAYGPPVGDDDIVDIHPNEAELLNQDQMSTPKGRSRVHNPRLPGGRD